MKKQLVILLLLILPISVFLIQNLLKNDTPKAKVEQEDIITLTPEDIIESNIFIGDTGTGEADQYTIANIMEDFCNERNCKSIIITGDVIYDKGVNSVDDEQFQTKFELPYKNFEMPFYITLGNHDYYGCEDCYIEYSKQSEKFVIPEKYYSITNNPYFDIFIIDTQDFDVDQANWLTNEIQKSNKLWTIVVGHKPIITSEALHAEDNWDGKNALKDILCQKVDFYISGHSHSLEDLGNIDDKCKVNQIISGAGSQERELGNDIEQISDDFFYGDEGFISMSLTKNNSLYFEFIDDDGKVIYTKLINAKYNSYGEGN